MPAPTPPITKMLRGFPFELASGYLSASGCLCSNRQRSNWKSLSQIFLHSRASFSKYQRPLREQLSATAVRSLSSARWYLLRSAPPDDLTFAGENIQQLMDETNTVIT